MINTIKPTDKLHFVLHASQIDYNEEKINALKVEIADKYGVPVKNVKIEFKPLLVGKKGSSMTGDIIESLQDPQFMLVLFDDYLRQKKYMDVSFDAIKTIDEQVNQYIDFNQYSKHKTYSFKYVKWSNYLSFGPDNYFDFTKMHGLVLLNSNPGNQGGKTTFAINLLRFALFGKSTKSPNLNDVFNDFLPEATSVNVEVGLEIDGEEYVIRRTVTRPAINRRSEKSKPKQTVEYFKKNGDELESIENCEGESTQETNNIIKETVGNPDDFDLIISATRKTLDNLFEKGKTEQGRLFSRWLGLLAIEEKENVAKDLWKKNINPTLLSNKYNRTTLELEIKDFNTCNDENEKSIKDYEGKKNAVNDKLIELNKKKVDVLKNRKEIKEELKKLDVATINNNITLKNSELETKRGKFKGEKDEYAKVKDSTFNEDDYKALQAQIKEKEKDKQQLEIKNAELREKIKTITGEIKKINDLIAQGVCPNCSQKIDVTVQNGLIDEKELEKNRLTANGVTNKQKIEKIEGEIKDLEAKQKDMEAERDNVNKQQRLKLTLVALKENIEKIKLEIEKLEKQKQDIETNKDNIEYNNKIDNQIRLIDDEIRENEKLKDDYLLNIQSCQSNIATNNKAITERDDIIKILKEEEVTIRNWTVYQELVGKNGIIKIVLKRALPLLNNEIKRILDGICDFTIELDVDDKNEIAINMVCDGVVKPIEVGGSGFEATFAALAVRSALASISSITRPSFLTLDEVDSTVNPENVDMLYELYNRILQNYSFIFHIVHDDSVVDRHDSVVTIVKEGHISKIEM